MFLSPENTPNDGLFSKAGRDRSVSENVLLIDYKHLDHMAYGSPKFSQMLRSSLCSGPIWNLNQSEPYGKSHSGARARAPTERRAESGERRAESGERRAESGERRAAEARQAGRGRCGAWQTSAQSLVAMWLSWARSGPKGLEFDPTALMSLHVRITGRHHA
jgi:hypothetical protein